MELLEVFGYVGALMVGIVLGLIGGGGSILTVPILVYLFGLNPITATAYSLFIVGFTSVIGAIKNFRKGFVDFKTAVIFSIPALTAVYLTRRFLVTLIPDIVFTIGSFEVTNSMFIMVFFAVIMILASISMIRKKSLHSATTEVLQVSYNYPLIAAEGIIVGVLTGVVGAGGGFLIIPALVLLAKLPMKKAIGTSLLIVAVKSLIGFLGDLSSTSINWEFLWMFTGLSVIGIFAGVYASKFIPGQNLKKGFGYFTLAMAFYILYKEL